MNIKKLKNRENEVQWIAKSNKKIILMQKVLNT